MYGPSGTSHSMSTPPAAAISETAIVIASHGKRMPRCFERVRESGAEHERAHEEPDGVAEIALVPAGRDPHADRIDAREKEPGQEAGREERMQARRRRHSTPRFASRTEQRAHEEQLARRIAVRERRGTRRRACRR